MTQRGSGFAAATPPARVEPVSPTPGPVESGASAARLRSLAARRGAQPGSDLATLLGSLDLDRDIPVDALDAIAAILACLYRADHEAAADQADASGTPYDSIAQDATP